MNPVTAHVSSFLETKSQNLINVGNRLGCTTLFRLHSKRPLLARFIETSKLQEFVDVEGRIFSVLKCLPHPNLPRVIACIDNFSGHRDEQSPSVSGSVLVFPNYHSDLHTLIRERSRLGENLSRHYFKQLLNATAHLHAHNIALRDIRLGKIMFADREQQQIVFADLHGACFFPAASHTVDCRNMSPAYVAPEIILHPYHESSRVAAVDMWSLGVILYVMLTGCYPFSSMNPASLCKKIVSCRYAAPAGASAGVRRLLSRLLCVDPNHRLTAREVLNDPWVCGPGTGYSSSSATSSKSGSVCEDSESEFSSGSAGSSDQVVPSNVFCEAGAGAVSGPAFSASGIAASIAASAPVALPAAAPAPASLPPAVTSASAGPFKPKSAIADHTVGVDVASAVAGSVAPSGLAAAQPQRGCKRGAGQDSGLFESPLFNAGVGGVAGNDDGLGAASKRLCRAPSWTSESTECDWE